MPLPPELSSTVELVVDPKTGVIRQAGADGPGQFIIDFKARAESSLFLFSKGILGFERLSRNLHRPICQWLQGTPPYRKLLLMPRDHLKTTMCRALAIHMLIQPDSTNPYFPGIDGATTRILLANETATNAEHQLRWIMMQFETNQLLRALWPHRVWENARRQSKKWNEKEMMLPRSRDYPEASIETIGVGGAVTGRHYDAMIKDDLATLKAANSPLEMQTAIEWHISSRALMDDPDKSLEIIVGTRWAVHDIYQYIMENDNSVECIVRAIIENGLPIMPEIFSLDTIARLQSEFKTLFPLIYMNSATDPELVDFDVTQIRHFRIVGDKIDFLEDTRDMVLQTQTGSVLKPKGPSRLKRGAVLGRKAMDELFDSRGEYLKLRRINTN